MKGEDFLKEAKALLETPGSNMDMRRRTILNRAYYAAYHAIMKSQCVSRALAHTAARQR